MSLSTLTVKAILSALGFLQFTFISQPLSLCYTNIHTHKCVTNVFYIYFFATSSKTARGARDRNATLALRHTLS